MTEERVEKIEEIFDKVYMQQVHSRQFFIVDGWNDIEVFNKECEERGLINDETGEILNWDSYCEEIGWEWGFADEYSTCGNCGGLIKTSPDYYGWTPDYWITDGDITCGDCVREDFAEEYIGEILHGYHHCHDFSTANVLIGFDQLYKMGFYKLDEKYYNGMHHGMNDKPEDVFKKLEKKHWVLFEIHPSQFYVKFEVWVKDKQGEIEFINEEGDIEYWEGDVDLMDEVVDNMNRDLLTVLKKRVKEWNEEG